MNKKKLNIVVKNANQKHKLSERFIVELTSDILKILKLSPNTKLDIVFLSDRAIEPFNRLYKKKNGATDVLSFDLGSCGQILISSDMALRNSRAFNTSFERELVLYLIHGILHLFGYDDRSLKKKLRMFKKQDSVLERLCAKIKLSKVLTRR
ncbi:MAG: rRNA maturation RNase YbeY [Candidatus Omnitrophota bacterium]|nr:rRNA maturation RNase YbeY [Candidatus Omnitrophota bacterium]